MVTPWATSPYITHHPMCSKNEPPRLLTASAHSDKIGKWRAINRLLRSPRSAVHGTLARPLRNCCCPEGSLELSVQAPLHAPLSALPSPIPAHPRPPRPSSSPRHLPVPSLPASSHASQGAEIRCAEAQSLAEVPLPCTCSLLSTSISSRLRSPPCWCRRRRLLKCCVWMRVVEPYLKTLHDLQVVEVLRGRVVICLRGRMR